MNYPCWVTPTDDVLAQIVLSEEEYCALTPEEPPVLTIPQQNAATDALFAAQGILSLLAGSHLHGSGRATDMYVINGSVRRVSTTFRPIREILEAEYVTDSGNTVALYDLVGQVIFFDKVSLSLGNLCGHYGGGKLRITYRYGSTMTTAARLTTIYYARQLYLSGPCGDRDLCELPERVTSVNREGISMSLIDPQTFIDKGRTGLIKVDQWLSTYLTRRGTRAPGIYSADAPPPNNIGVWC